MKIECWNCGCNYDTEYDEVCPVCDEHAEDEPNIEEDVEA